MSTPPARRGLSRRDFLRVSAAAAAGAVLGPRGILWAQEAATRPAYSSSSLVVTVRSERVVHGMQVKQKLLRRMIELGLQKLSGKDDPASAWARFVTPGQRILLKFTRLCGAELGTEPAMLGALVDSLVLAGHEPGRIRVADCDYSRYLAGLDSAPSGWSERTVQVGEEQEQLREYLDGVDAIINVPSLTDDNLAGLSCAMLNVSLPFIRHPARYYGEPLPRSVAALCGSAEIRPRVKLTLVNALRCVFDGGPLVSSDKVAYDHSIWGSSDMVAIDLLAQDWVDRHRRMRGLKSLAESGRAPLYIQAGAELGLGQADLRQIVRRTYQL